MDVKLLHHTPLWVASTAIRKCWASEDKSDTLPHMDKACESRGFDNIGPKDKELKGNK